MGLRNYEHISDRLRSLEWLPIREKLILNDASMMHECINKFVPDYLADMFRLRRFSKISPQAAKINGGNNLKFNF